MQWQEIRTLSLISKWRNWIISKRQETNKKQAAAISVEACPGLSTKADKLQY